MLRSLQLHGQLLLEFLPKSTAVRQRVVALCGLRGDLAQASYKMSMTLSRFDLKSLSPSLTPSPICRIMTSGSSPKTDRESAEGGFVRRDIDFQRVTSRVALPALSRLLGTMARRILFCPRWNATPFARPCRRLKVAGRSSYPQYKVHTRIPVVERATFK